MEYHFDPSQTTKLKLEDPQGRKGETIIVETASNYGLVEVEGLGVLKPGSRRVFRSNGRRWVRCYVRELLAVLKL